MEKTEIWLKAKVTLIKIPEVNKSIDSQMTINKKLISLSTLKIMIYILKALICNYTQPQSAITTWIEIYPFVEMVYWKVIYQLSKNIPPELLVKKKSEY